MHHRPAHAMQSTRGSSQDYRVNTASLNFPAMMNASFSRTITENDLPQTIQDPAPPAVAGGT